MKSIPKIAMGSAALVLAMSGCGDRGSAPADSSTMHSAPKQTSTLHEVQYLDPVTGYPQTRPPWISLAVADGGWMITDIRWTEWGDQTATATGSETQKLCDPSCADGRTFSSRVSLTLSAVAPSKGGNYRVFTQLMVTTISGRSDTFTIGP